MFGCFRGENMQFGGKTKLKNADIVSKKRLI